MTHARLEEIMDWAQADVRHFGAPITSQMIRRGLERHTPEGRIYAIVYRWPHLDIDDCIHYLETFGVMVEERP